MNESDIDTDKSECLVASEDLLRMDTRNELSDLREVKSEVLSTKSEFKGESPKSEVLKSVSFKEVEKKEKRVRSKVDQFDQMNMNINDDILTVNGVNTLSDNKSVPKNDTITTASKNDKKNDNKNDSMTAVSKSNSGSTISDDTISDAIEPSSNTTCPLQQYASSVVSRKSRANSATLSKRPLESQRDLKLDEVLSFILSFLCIDLILSIPLYSSIFYALIVIIILNL